MLDKNHVVDVPNGAIVRSNRIVLWTVGKNYIAAKQYNEDVRRMIGKTLATDKSKMYPNDILMSKMIYLNTKRQIFFLLLDRVWRCPW